MYSKSGRDYTYKRGRGSSWVRTPIPEYRPKSLNRCWKRQELEEKGELKANNKDDQNIQDKSFKLVNQESSLQHEPAEELERKLSAASASDTNGTHSRSALYKKYFSELTLNNDQMEKVGRNKLILKKVGTDIPISNPTTQNVIVNQSPSLKKIGVAFGTNKLILKKEKVTNNESSIVTISFSTVDELPNGMMTKGRNKLVSEARLLQDKQEWNERLKKRNLESGRVRGSGTAKRIKLVGIVENNEGEEDEHNSVIIEKLSDFAYQKTTKAPRNKYRRNMGLVRMANAENLPICSAFARGLPCSNRLCIKRHDVAIEAYTPICSFFQRSGQCLKRDTCPFRHIKVNPHAMICSSFALLGYCEKEDCVMKHVRHPKTPHKAC